MNFFGHVTCLFSFLCSPRGPFLRGRSRMSLRLTTSGRPARVMAKKKKALREDVKAGAEATKEAEATANDTRTAAVVASAVRAEAIARFEEDSEASRLSQIIHDRNAELGRIDSEFRRLQIRRESVTRELASAHSLLSGRRYFDEAAVDRRSFLLHRVYAARSARSRSRSPAATASLPNRRSRSRSPR